MNTDDERAARQATIRRRKGRRAVKAAQWAPVDAAVDAQFGPMPDPETLRASQDEMNERIRDLAHGLHGRTHA